MAPEAPRAGSRLFRHSVARIGLWLLLIETNAFYSSVLATILIWTIATSGLNIIAGLGGYPSLVQGAFYGIGAYSSALAMKWGQPFWASCFEAVGAASLLGLVIGLVFHARAASIS